MEIPGGTARITRSSSMIELSETASDGFADYRDLLIALVGINLKGALGTTDATDATDEEALLPGTPQTDPYYLSRMK